MDVTQKDQVQEAVKQGIARFGQVDILVNNAGFGMVIAIEEATDPEVRSSSLRRWVRRSGHCVSLREINQKSVMASYFPIASDQCGQPARKKPCLGTHLVYHRHHTATAY